MEDLISYERRVALCDMEKYVNTEKRLAVFSDYGLDDACATLYLLEHRENYERIDIVPIGGNVHALEALRNARKLLCAARDWGISMEGLAIVDTTDRYQKFCNLPSIHGRDGMGDILRDVNFSPVPEIKFDEWTQQIGEGYEILSLGPCTMVEHTLAESRALPSGRIFIMGGCVDEEPNFNGREFNDGVDHRAYLATIRRPHLIATLDTCRIPSFNLAGGRENRGKLLDKFVNRSIELATARHPENCYIYDYIAVYAMLNPDKFDVERIFVPEIDAHINMLSLKAEYHDSKDLL